MLARKSKEMRWPGERNVTEGELRHPADAETWKALDIHFPDFASDFRNVRLGLITDGFNPFIGSTSSPYNTWPVMLIPYINVKLWGTTNKFGERYGLTCVVHSIALNKRKIFEWIQEVSYPLGYAGRLHSKINIKDKKNYWTENA